MLVFISGLSVFPTVESAQLVGGVSAQKKATWWQPAADDQLQWYWQLQDPVDPSHEVDIYNIDIETPQIIIDELKQRGVRLICYLSVGTVEWFRDDAVLIPKASIGQVYDGYPDEQWLNIADIDSLSAVMLARLDRCANKGFDAIEGDNVDAFNQESYNAAGQLVGTGTNFNISAEQSIVYIRWLAAESHKRGLGFGLKNAEALAPVLVNDVDWMLIENCYVDGWCDDARVFIDANKPVFMTEYRELLRDFTPACDTARRLGYTAIWRSEALDSNGPFERCR
ncbi:hypothetical protein AB833_30130 [Chromatiales bacterium (ex Bugula neritina AB1)]|nr:hypothetical protein AB833_30130 [Chromatiales bacterium (ex Bugula neritina AB1)]